MIVRRVLTSARRLFRPATVAAFAAGCVTATLVGWIVVDVTARAESEPGIHACADAEGVLRLASSPSCPAGQRSLYFAKPDVDVDQAKEPSTPEKASAIDARRLADLDAKIKELEGAAGRGELGNRAVAPFVVVDKEGRRIFDVDKVAEGARAQVYNTAGNGVATMWALDGGGQFVARSASGELSTYLGIFRDGKVSGLRLLETGQTRVDLGRDEETAAYRLKVFGKNGKSVAGIGQNRLGSGTAQVADENGRVKGFMGVDTASKGRFEIYNDSGVAVSTLMEGASAGGLLTIWNAAGQKAMVEAGVDAKGFGVVRAGPEGFKPGLGLLGLPGSYIAGKP